MAKAAAKTKEDEIEEREIPVIKPADMTVQAAGQVFKEVVVFLPPDLMFQDINDHPNIWRLVQADRQGLALAEYDRVEMRAADWTAFGVVNYADNGQVILYDIRKASKPTREVALFSDKNFEIKWTQEGFTYFRKSDGVRMSGPTYSTPDAAKAALMREQYPARV